MQRDEGRKEGRTAEGGQPAGRGKQSDNTREAFEYFRSAAYHYTAFTSSLLTLSHVLLISQLGRPSRPLCCYLCCCRLLLRDNVRNPGPLRPLITQRLR